MKIKLAGIAILTIVLAVGQPLIAQLAPCFVRCHSAAMEREAFGMDWDENNRLFKVCINDEC